MPSPARDTKLSFSRIWQRYSQEILAGQSDIDIEGNHMPIYTLVSRLPAFLVDRIQSALTPAGPDWDAHYVYPPSTVHMTLLFLSPYLGITPDMAKSEEYERLTRARQIVKETLDDVGPMRFRARGLNVFPTTVFLQLLQPEPQTLCGLRRELASRLKSAEFTNSSADSYERAMAWHLAFANVVRFRQPVASSIVSAVEDLRETDFGELTLPSVELVSTDKMLSDEQTVSLERFELAGQGYPT
jgi:2'-5' RNA ligase